MSISLSHLGIVCALGRGQQAVLENCLAGLSPGMTLRDDLRPGAPCYVAEVKTPLPDLSQYAPEWQNRCNQIAHLAYSDISDGVRELPYASDRIGIVIGTSTSGIEYGETAMMARLEGGAFPEDFTYATQEMTCPAEFLAHLSEAQGPCMSISTACSSSAKALITARNMIESGLIDAAIVGGVDSLCKLTVSGFSALESVSAEKCSPFSEGRDGINIGEGAALFIMQRAETGIMLAGYGESTDAHHISAPDPSGQGALTAMQRAIQKAGLTADDVSYLNLHGTGTPKNDEMEALATQTLLPDVACSSTKALTGHTLGAAGALEAAICWLLLSSHNTDNLLPGTVMCKPKDETLASIQLLTESTRAQAEIKHCLSNSFAFGGSNAAILLSKENDDV